MKKIFLFTPLFLMAGLSACDSDNYEERTQSFATNTINIVTDMTDGTVTASQGSYYYNVKMTSTAMTGTISTSDIIQNNVNLAFSTEDQDYKSTGYDSYFPNVKGSVKNNPSMMLSNANFLAVYMFEDYYNKNGYYYTIANAGEYTYKVNPMMTYITVAKYDIGTSYRVNTFQNNTFFKGTTSTNYVMQGESHTYTTDEIIYRFIVSIDDKGVASADMIIYNAKFSDNEREPVKEAILAKGLDVEFTASGITISGENIVPGMLEAGSFTDVPNFTFNSVKFQSSGDYYTHGTIDYQVAGIYNGHFEGAYMYDYYIDGEKK